MPIFQPTLRDRLAGGRYEVERSVPLAGVAQIPDDAVETMTYRGEFGLTDEQIARCDEIIWGPATEEIRRRREAHMARMPLDQYFGRDYDDDE